MSKTQVTRAVLEAKKSEYEGELAKVRAELNRLSQMAMRLQGAIASVDELLKDTDDDS